MQLDRSLRQGHRHWHLSAMALQEHCSARRVGSPPDEPAEPACIEHGATVYDKGDIPVSSLTQQDETETRGTDPRYGRSSLGVVLRAVHGVDFRRHRFSDSRGRCGPKNAVHRTGLQSCMGTRRRRDVPRTHVDEPGPAAHGLRWPSGTNRILLPAFARSAMRCRRP